MGKQQGRKPKKRPPGRPKIDDDLIELTRVLAEREYVANPEGWFSLPWRDGWNAARLCYICAVAIAGTSNATGDLINMINMRPASTFAYERADEFRVSMVARANEGSGLWGSQYQMLAAGFRCAQLTIANSSGGGEVFNDVLRLAFSASDNTLPYTLQGEVREARCYDAIGVGPDLQNDKHDRLRHAFSIAWDRGLYQAAYALPRAI